VVLWHCCSHCSPASHRSWPLALPAPAPPLCDGMSNTVSINGVPYAVRLPVVSHLPHVPTWRIHQPAPVPAHKIAVSTTPHSLLLHSKPCFDLTSNHDVVHIVAVVSLCSWTYLRRDRSVEFTWLPGPATYQSIRFGAGNTNSDGTSVSSSLAYRVVSINYFISSTSSFSSWTVTQYASLSDCSILSGNQFVTQTNPTFDSSCYNFYGGSFSLYVPRQNSKPSAGSTVSDPAFHTTVYNYGAPNTASAGYVPVAYLLTIFILIYMKFTESDAYVCICM
jgi:hypothetical protein